ncbi:uncharacterized protein VP01_2467g3 [Puccinia sorghi]|uniref:Uncharacterized protein n=1 Tax=Puccinia sorghi TaxID=27349 RepID=A0A0L6V634_9BASI|nr:uncharacterized protein VP01_2467g3 [Puccinia sorghi]
MERSKREEGLREIQPVCRGATYPLTSNSYYPSKLFSNTRSMTSIYQLVSTRVKGHAPAIQKRDNLNGSTSSRSIRYSPSLTGSDTIGGRNHGGQSTTSVPSLSNSVSSQSTVFSSLSVGHPTFSDDFCPLSPTSSSISSKPSLRSTSGSAINKSFQSLIRRRKQKFTDLNGSQPRSSLNIDTNLCTDIKPHKPMPKSAAASRIHFVGNAESGSSTMLFGSFPVNPLQSNDCHSSILECGHDNFKPPQTTIFSGSIVSKDLPLAGTHPRQPAPKVIVRKNTNSLSDDSEMEDMLANLRNIAATRKPMVPAAEKQPVSPELEGEDEDDSETEDMMANLRGIAASRKPAGLTAEEQFTSLLSARSGSALLEDDQSSIACSESDSESSFEADAVADELPDHFPLPSWPKLDSTSQSPFTQQSLTSSAYSPADCSVSFSREHLC